MECLLLYPYAPVDIELIIPLKHSDIDLIRDAEIIFREDDFDDSVVDLFFSYLFSAGYLDVVDVNQSGDDCKYLNKYSVKIPNNLHRYQLRRHLMTYYKRTFNVADGFLKPYVKEICPAQQALQNMFCAASNASLDGDPTATMRAAKYKFQENLQKLLEAMPPHGDFTSSLPVDSSHVMQGNEDLYHSMFNHMASSLEVILISIFSRNNN